MKILLTTRNKNNLFSWAIRKFMGTSYSHCCMHFMFMGVEVIVEATVFKGVRIQTLENFMKTNIVLEELQVKNGAMFNDALNYCFNQLGDKYSFWSLIGMIFNNDKIGADGENSFNCSELIARAFGVKHRSLDHIDVKELKEILERP